MYSVTGRIQQIKQPRGGYIQPRSFTVVNFNDGKSVSEDINVSAAIIGLAVDYMLRYLMSEKANIIKAFEVSCMGAIISEKLMNNEAKKEICGYLKNIKGLDDNSIINACKAVTFDVWFRNFSGAMKSRKACDTNPNAETIENIRIYIQRSLKFWDLYGPIKAEGITFEKKGYTKTVSTGDADYLTNDTLWDIKVLKSSIQSKHTLQLLMYYIMGKHSEKSEFNDITKIGIYNPRLNEAYILKVSEIPEEIIKMVEKDVICYE